jgi:isopentenyl diphosphate isomerase/L-lactate dehydrogenase-like FMN-dependent dehydrogenase
VAPSKDYSYSFDGTTLRLIYGPGGRPHSRALDSGVRRGGDALKALALKALALSASYAWVGRPFMYAAAGGGQAGVAHAIWMQREEIGRNMPCSA